MLTQQTQSWSIADCRLLHATEKKQKGPLPNSGQVWLHINAALTLQNTGWTALSLAWATDFQIVHTTDTVVSLWENLPCKDVVDVRTTQLGTNHCNLTAVVLWVIWVRTIHCEDRLPDTQSRLYKEKSMCLPFSWWVPDGPANGCLGLSEASWSMPACPFWHQANLAMLYWCNKHCHWQACQQSTAVQ